jgi:hypothetical protein
MTVEDLDNIKLQRALHEAASAVSYYHAAEADWGKEAESRAIADARWNELKAEAIKRGCYNKHDFKFYLVQA